MQEKLEDALKAQDHAADLGDAIYEPFKAFGLAYMELKSTADVLTQPKLPSAYPAVTDRAESAALAIYDRPSSSKRKGQSSTPSSSSSSSSSTGSSTKKKNKKKKRDKNKQDKLALADKEKGPSKTRGRSKGQKRAEAAEASRFADDPGKYVSERHPSHQQR